MKYQFLQAQTDGQKLDTTPASIQLHVPSASNKKSRLVSPCSSSCSTYLLSSCGTPMTTCSSRMQLDEDSLSPYLAEFELTPRGTGWGIASTSGTKSPVAPTTIGSLHLNINGYCKFPRRIGSSLNSVTSDAMSDISSVYTPQQPRRMYHQLRPFQLPERKRFSQMSNIVRTPDTTASPSASRMETETPALTIESVNNNNSNQGIEITLFDKNNTNDRQEIKLLDNSISAGTAEGSDRIKREGGPIHMTTGPPVSCEENDDTLPIILDFLKLSPYSTVSIPSPLMSTPKSRAQDCSTNDSVQHRVISNDELFQNIVDLLSPDLFDDYKKPGESSFSPNDINPSNCSTETVSTQCGSDPIRCNRMTELLINNEAPHDLSRRSIDTQHSLTQPETSFIDNRSRDSINEQILVSLPLPATIPFEQLLTATEEIPFDVVLPQQSEFAFEPISFLTDLQQENLVANTEGVQVSQRYRRADNIVPGIVPFTFPSTSGVKKPENKIRKAFNLDDKLHRYSPQSNGSASSSPDEHQSDTGLTTDARSSTTSTENTTKKTPRKRREVKFFNNEFNQFVSGTHKTQQRPSRDKYKFTKMYW